MQRVVSGACWLSAAILVACGSDDPRAKPLKPEVEGPTRADVLEACEAFAESYCNGMADCCSGVHGTHDAEACRERFESTVCRPGADAVVAGQAVLDSEAVGPCLAAYERAFETCQADWEEILELRADIYRACRVIDGRVEAGGGCQSSVTCRKPEGPATAACVAGTCREVFVLSEGETCPFPSGDVSPCASGLYCTSPGLQEAGVCAQAVETGGDCDPNRTANVCGLGHYCDRASESCQPAANFGGPDCEQHGECVGFSCDQTAGECAPASVVSLQTCVGR